MTNEPFIPSFIGAPVQRREDPALITGTARYVDDMAPSGTLHLAVVRSPFAHASVTSIDFEAALQVRGVLLVITPDQVAAIEMPPTPEP
ncbi:MAG: xanthine dehydrogenase family protein molybdopterin-binding subunit, partial [Acidimicrobiia bacterium]